MSAAAFDYDYDAYDDAFRQEMIEKITKHPIEVATWVASKMCHYMGLFDYGFEMSYNHDETLWTKYPTKAFYSTQWFQYILYTLLALYGYLCYRKRHTPDVYQIFFIGNTLIYLFVEAFSSYRFENYFYMLFLTGYGLHEIYEKRTGKKAAAQVIQAP